MAQREEITFKEFRERFATEEECRIYLYENRFPEGFVCPRCGGKEYSYIKTRKVYQCSKCHKQVSLTANTVMHRTHLPLTIWFWAIYLCVTDKRGISAVCLQKSLCTCYESAWYLLKRIRKAMGQRDQKYLLSGLVEMDEAYTGGQISGEKRGRGTSRPPIGVAHSKSSCGRPGFLRIEAIDNLTHEALQKFADKNIAQDSTIECDGWRSYQCLEGYIIQAKNYSPDDHDLKWVHTAISNLKAFLLGTYHGRATDLQSYFYEFCYRYNRRWWPLQLFPRAISALATSCG